MATSIETQNRVLAMQDSPIANLDYKPPIMGADFKVQERRPCLDPKLPLSRHTRLMTIRKMHDLRPLPLLFVKWENATNELLQNSQYNVIVYGFVSSKHYWGEFDDNGQIFARDPTAPVYLMHAHRPIWEPLDPHNADITKRDYTLTCRLRADGVPSVESFVMLLGESAMKAVAELDTHIAVTLTVNADDLLCHNRPRYEVHPLSVLPV